MNKYHYNSRGKVSVCKAKKNKCPFGEEKHFESFALALKAFEKEMETQLFNAVNKQKELEEKRENFYTLLKFGDKLMSPNNIANFMEGYKNYPEKRQESLHFINNYLHRYDLEQNPYKANVSLRANFTSKSEDLTRDLNNFIDTHRDYLKEELEVDISTSWAGNIPAGSNLSIIIKPQDTKVYLQSSGFFTHKREEFNSVNDLVKFVKDNPKMMKKIHASAAQHQKLKLERINDLSNPLDNKSKEVYEKFS